MSISANFNGSHRARPDVERSQSDWREKQGTVELRAAETRQGDAGQRQRIREPNSKDIGAELVFVQERSLRYRSFYWQQAPDYGLQNERVVGTLPEQVFTPEALSKYGERIADVIQQQIPQKCCWRFLYRGQVFAFELIISPILQTQGTYAVLVMGCRLSEAAAGHLPPEPICYRKLLSSIAQKTRRTLDVDLIRQQAVNSLGAALRVSRCLVLSYNPQEEQLEVKAEYCQDPLRPLLGCRFPIQAEPYLKQVVCSTAPIALNSEQADVFEQYSVLVVSTCYQDVCNGIIMLGQDDRQRRWSAAEVELVQELAEHLGTVIAHATIYQELEQATQRAEEASRLKSEFLASTTHELRTPLNGIIGFLKLILDGMADDSQEQQEFLEQAYSSALHLLNLINDILDIAKIEAGKMELELSTVPLDELFRDVEKFTRADVEKKRLYLKLKLPPTYDQVMLYGNYQRLLQVMLNLVSNAIKFTHEGGIVISGEIVPKKIDRHEQEFPGLVKISVADTGIGVSLEKQDKLFEKFVQADGSRTKGYGGTGLGLAISQKLIEAMGGKIYFYSMGEGLGSTVTFTIPLNHVPIMKTAETGDRHLLT
ncbi:MAG: ATP-binding protein [Cyanophyceae cyanobacterium]